MKDDIIFILIGAAVAVMLVIGGTLIVNNSDIPIAGGRGGGSSNAIQITKIQTATTSPEYIASATATTSADAIDIRQSDTVTVNSHLFASSSSSILQTQLYFSNDENEPRNWFPSPTVYSHQGNDTASTSLEYDTVTDVNARFLRVDYNLVGGNGAVYLEVAN